MTGRYKELHQRALHESERELRKLREQVERLRRECDEARLRLERFSASVAELVADDRPYNHPDRRDPNFLIERLRSYREDYEELMQERSRLMAALKGGER